MVDPPNSIVRLDDAQELRQILLANDALLRLRRIALKGKFLTHTAAAVIDRDPDLIGPGPQIGQAG